MTSHQLLAEWSRWFWPVFANHLWQATLFAIVAWIAAVWLKQARARRVVWLMAFAKFLLPSAALVMLAHKLGLNFSLNFLWTALWQASGEMTATVDTGVLLQFAEPVAQASSSGNGAGHSEVFCILTGLWLVGIALCFARWGMRRRRLAAALLAGERIESGREAEMIEDLKSRLSVRRPVGLIVSSRFTGPAVWRALRPVIILPRGLAEQLSDGEIHSVLSHEMFHVKHFDNLFNSLQMLVCSLLWFHPLVWLVDRRLTEERELICDERVVLYGAAPEAYAASLWKVVHIGFGWPVEGVSRATGSNLKKRIKLMLNANYRSKSSTSSRALAAFTFLALIALAAAMALFSRDGAQVAEATMVQDQKYVATAPARFENLPEIPVVITEARLSAGESRVMTSGVDSDSKAPSYLPLRGGTARDVEFSASLVNLSDRRVTEIMVEIQNESFMGNEPVSILSKPIINSGAPGKQGVAAPQESFASNIRFPFREKKGDQDLMSHLYNFKVRVTGVKFEGEEYWLMAQPGKTPSVAKIKMAMDSREKTPSGATKTIMTLSSIKQGEQDQGATGSIQQMTSSMRPTILYKEKAAYTQEAKDNNVQGTVVLSIVFGVDGQLRDIKVVRGLPHGLTEKAIEAAQKIRFEPAMKDGQPVSVRGVIEFTFNLYDKPIQPMSSSLRPTILYREKAQYTQEAKDNKVEGTVVLSVTFGADSRISDIAVIQGLPHGLSEKAIEAAKKIRFTPAVKDGQPVSVHGKLEFTFSLH